MLDIPSVIKKYHIPSLSTITDDALLFSFGSLCDVEIKVTKNIIENLSTTLSGDKNLKVTEFMHKIVPGPWLKGTQELNKLYYAPYFTNNVIPGDLIAMLHDGADSRKDIPDVCLYLGKGKYLTKPSPDEELYAVNSANLCNLFPNKNKRVLRGFHRNYGENFENFYHDLLVSQQLQISTNKTTSSTYGFPGTQRLYDSYVAETYSIYEAFDDENISKDIILSLNERKVVRHIAGDYYLHQNRNSNSFYRDANYSFSIVDHKDGKEIVMCSFLPDGKDIEIVQIGGNASYNEDFMSLWTIIIDHMKEYVSSLGFSRIKILRGDKNINYIHPKQRGLREGFDIRKHQETLLLRYNATPHRKRGFTRPDEWYSYFDCGINPGKYNKNVE